MKRIHLLNVIILFPFFIHNSARGQIINNSSFEGPTGSGLVPPGWQACGMNSSPDTQPGAWHVEAPASDGESYLGLVCRNNQFQNSDTGETCQQQLSLPLLTGITYTVSMDVCYSGEMYATPNFDPVYFNKPAKLRAWGSDSICEYKDILFETDNTVTTSWKRISFNIKPSFDYHFILLEAAYLSYPTYLGNIMIDNFTIDFEITVPNLIFNSGSGNDKFFVKDLISGLELIIYDMNGRLIYRTNNYQNDWDVSNMRAGVYLYILTSPFLLKPKKGCFVVLR